MRLLIACTSCQRQYDAGGRRIGSRLRCHCGEVMTVAEPRGHDAAVVRCSSCGAPREEQSRACRFCHADFTLHERDLHTVCPACFARVSDRAKYCHHCATPLVPEPAGGEETSLVCPACADDPPLTSRRMGKLDVTILECGLCTGLWMGGAAFEELADRVARQSAGKDASVTPGPRAGNGLYSQQRGPRYRKCPYCGLLMQRRQYARRSGVILDVCRRHGVWFDPHELPQVLSWIRSGGDPEPTRKRSKLRGQAAGEPTRRTTAQAVGDAFLEGLLESALDVFRAWGR